MKSFAASGKYVVAAVLAAMVIAVFGRVVHFPFICFDDDAYILNNPSVQGGLSLEGIRYAFTSDLDSGRIPLTWLSRLLDISLFGMDAGKHHLVNLLLHLLNTLLLFHVMRGMTGKLWESGLTAAIFAIHPIHVESVAWVIERKDVLAGLFWMLSMGAYLRYAGKPGVARYCLLLVLFLLGLMSKAVLVTFPFVLLLLDFWPLGRISPLKARNFPVSAGRMLLEKIPMLLLTLVVSGLTVWSQGRIGTVTSIDHIPLGARAALALQSYGSYLGKVVWPSGLAVFYPHPGSHVVLWKTAASASVLAVATMVVACKGRTRGWLVVGWLWFLGTLVPTLGFVQVGSQAMADRYMYLPMIGLCVMSAWGIGELAGRRNGNAVAAVALSGAWLAALMACAVVQVGYWRGSVPLFMHALEVTGDNWGAQNSLGIAATQAGKGEEAITRFREAVRLRPDMAVLRVNLAGSLARAGRLDEAAVHFREALRLDPGDGESAYSMYVLLSRQGKQEEAVRYLSEGMDVLPGDAAGNNRLGLLLAGRERFEDAAARFNEAIRIRPDYWEAHYNLAVALGRLGRKAEAIPHFKEALRMPGVDAESHNRIGVALVRLERLDEAAAHFREALRLQPDHADARTNLRVIQERSGKNGVAGGG